jgi:dihydroorotase
MLDAAMVARKKGLILMSHSEDKEIAKVDSRLSENIMSFRNIEIAKAAGCRFHLAHVSTKESMQYVIDAKKQGFDVSCEVMPHHIALTEEADYSVNPPLRKKDDVNFLIKCIAEGWVDVIATDHAPHSREDKLKGSPGISGIETAFSVCYTKLVREGYITLSKLSELMSYKAAVMLGFNKGKISPGFDGDIVLVDLDKKYIIDADQFASKGKNTPFNGEEVYGDVVYTIKAGKIVYSRNA